MNFDILYYGHGFVLFFCRFFGGFSGEGVFVCLLCGLLYFPANFDVKLVLMFYTYINQNITNQRVPLHEIQYEIQ